MDVTKTNIEMIGNSPFKLYECLLGRRENNLILSIGQNIPKHSWEFGNQFIVEQYEPK